jgi:hypothetical protein
MRTYLTGATLEVHGLLFRPAASCGVHAVHPVQAVHRVLVDHEDAMDRVDTDCAKRVLVSSPAHRRNSWR